MWWGRKAACAWMCFVFYDLKMGRIPFLFFVLSKLTFFFNFCIDDFYNVVSVSAV